MSDITHYKSYTALHFVRSKINTMLSVGSQGVYEWLVTDDNFDLLQLCPEIVLAKYVSVTSIDSSELVPTEQETAVGWQSRGKIAYSPKIQTIEELPHAGWDEWYIFDNVAELGRATSEKISLRCTKSRDT